MKTPIQCPGKALVVRYTGSGFAAIIGIALFYIFSLSAHIPVDSNGGWRLVVLGRAQDGGKPHAGCRKDCCQRARKKPSEREKTTSLGLVDPEGKRFWIFDAGPDFPAQNEMMLRLTPEKREKTPDGIFLTHAHIGHYSGLMHLGREVMGSQGTPVYAMPRMRSFLENNGPWSQLVKLENIRITSMKDDSAILIAPGLEVIPFRVPHRDEYSETVGFTIKSHFKKILFLPDIDKWEKWERDIVEEVKKADFAFLDGTFFGPGEVPGRSTSEIPHPLIRETMERFLKEPPEIRSRIHFIHLNHTNPALAGKSKALREIGKSGFHIAREGFRIIL